tara:strand:- start:324 stop:539 length:216 start_codon:yes stop_codon:yes gene_type:complete
VDRFENLSFNNAIYSSRHAAGVKVMITIAESRAIIRVIGPKVTFDEALWSALTYKEITPDVPPKHIQFVLL